MADAPTYVGASATAGGSGSLLSLSPPADNQVALYVVAFSFPGGSDSTDWTPTSSPALTRPTHVYDQKWPTSTPWEQPNFVLAVHGDPTLPALEWTFPTPADDVSIVRVIIADCTFLLRASDITLPADDNRSPAAQPGAAYSMRTATGIGDSSAPGPEQVSDPNFASSVPNPFEAKVDGSVAALFAATVPTIAAPGPPTIGNDAATFTDNTWTTNAALFPDVWGATLSIYQPGHNPDATYGWHTGRIGWG